MGVAEKSLLNLRYNTNKCINWGDELFESRKQLERHLKVARGQSSKALKNGHKLKGKYCSE